MRSTSAFPAGVVLTLLVCAPADRLLAEETTLKADALRAAQPAASDDTSSDAAQLVRDALAAEARGDAQARGELLRKAIDVDPRYAPAHWHSGDVRLGSQWMAFEKASATIDARGTMDKYRRLRDRVDRTAAAHVKLARWCASVGLNDQERTHLLFASYLQPSKSQRNEIVSRLGLVRYRGQLMSQAQADDLKREAEDAPIIKREQTRLKVNIKRDLAHRGTSAREALVNELSSTPKPLQVAVLESMLQEQGLPAEIAEAVFAVLAAEPGQAPTDALVRHAVFAQQQSTRKLAAEALRSKSFFAYVPTMVGALRSPMFVRLNFISAGNRLCHNLIMQQDGPSTDYLFSSAGATSVDIVVTTHLITHQPTDINAIVTPDPTLQGDALQAEQALAANEANAFLNQRIGAALQVTTGNNFDEVSQWWDWWNGYNEMYRPPYKPLHTQTVEAPSHNVVHVQNVSCFVAGTLVWTSTGPMPIEQLMPGESVLAQDPDSGELAYKPVMATTVRPPSATIEVKTDKATIIATKGHPFWIDGIGWQMAKELKVNQNLHSPHGPVKIESVSQELPVPCYNLVVADFNSYFVSEAQVLVHDNNLREVTTATVPGLVGP